MSDLRYVDQLKFEILFGMKSGYVLDFSNSSFQEFVIGSVNIDIYDEKFDYGSGSKANILRGFIKEARNFDVGSLLLDLLEHWKSLASDPPERDRNLYLTCSYIANKLKEDTSVQNLDALTTHSEDISFAKISEIIIHHIENNEPEVALDRLHTFLIKYCKKLCDTHHIEYSDDDVLNSLLGKYVRFIRGQNIVDSRVTFKILGCSIQILELFNNVRNDHSLAHDNPLLNYNESILIFNNICNLINFINYLEESIIVLDSKVTVDDVPF